MKYYLLTIFLFVATLGISQIPNQFNGLVNILSSSGGPTSYTLNTFFNHCTGKYESNQSQVGDVVFFNDGVDVVMGTITGISNNNGGIINMTVNANFSAPPSGIGAILRPTSNGYPVEVCGVSNDLQTAINNYFAILVDQSGVALPTNRIAIGDVTNKLSSNSNLTFNNGLGVFATPNSNYAAVFGGTGGIDIGGGTTAQRPVSPLDGSFRWNTDHFGFEQFGNSSWLRLVKQTDAVFPTASIPTSSATGILQGSSSFSYTPATGLQITGTSPTGTRRMLNFVTSQTDNPGRNFVFDQIQDPFNTGATGYSFGTASNTRFLLSNLSLIPSGSTRFEISTGSNLQVSSNAGQIFFVHNVAGYLTGDNITTSANQGFQFNVNGTALGNTVLFRHVPQISNFVNAFDFTTSATGNDAGALFAISNQARAMVGFLVRNTGSVELGNTGYTRISTGTTAQRPTSAPVGSLRYNTTIPQHEVWNGSGWVPFLSGAFSDTNLGNSNQTLIANRTVTGGGFSLSFTGASEYEFLGGPFYTEVANSYGGITFLNANTNEFAFEVARSNGSNGLTINNLNSEFFAGNATNLSTISLSPTAITIAGNDGTPFSYNLPRSAPGTGNRIPQWVNGVAGWIDTPAGGSGSVPSGSPRQVLGYNNSSTPTAQWIGSVKHNKPRGVMVHFGDSNTNGRPGYRIAYLQEWLSSGGIFEGWESYNMGQNGSILSSWAAACLSANNNATLSDWGTVGSGAPNIGEPGINPWAAVNGTASGKKADIVFISLGTNDLNSPSGRATIGTEANLRANLATFVNFLLENTSAHIVLRMPQPFVNEDFMGITQWVNDAEVLEANRRLKVVYREWESRHPRVTVYDSHSLFGESVTNKSTHAQDPLGGGALIADALHPNDLGYKRIVQDMLQLFDIGRPKLKNPINYPIDYWRNARWVKPFYNRSNFTTSVGNLTVFELDIALHHSTIGKERYNLTTSSTRYEDVLQASKDGFTNPSGSYQELLNLASSGDTTYIYSLVNGQTAKIAGLYQAQWVNSLDYPQVAATGRNVATIPVGPVLIYSKTRDVTPPFPAGQVLFGTGTGSGTSPNLFWDNTNGRLGINANVLNNSLHVKSTTNVGAMMIESTVATAAANIDFKNSSAQDVGTIGFGNPSHPIPLFANKFGFIAFNRDAFFSTNIASTALLYLQHANQRVGINKSDPATTLDVFGDMQVLTSATATNRAEFKVSQTNRRMQLTSFTTGGVTSDLVVDNVGFIAQASSGSGASNIEITPTLLKFGINQTTSNFATIEAALAGIVNGGVYTVDGETSVKTKTGATVSSAIPDTRLTGFTGTTATFTGFNVDAFWHSSRIEVYKNGLLLELTVDYTISSRTPLTLTLTSAAISADVYRVRIIKN